MVKNLTFKSVPEEAEDDVKKAVFNAVDIYLSKKGLVDAEVAIKASKEKFKKDNE